MTPFDIYFVSFETKLNFLLDCLNWTGAISKNASNILNSMILKRTLNQRRRKKRKNIFLVTARRYRAETLFVSRQVLENFYAHKDNTRIKMETLAP